MRKLASVQRIWKVEPIEGADRIELVHVLGWQCVANKGQFKEGDLAVYFEIDSFLPISPEFEFLRASSYEKNDLMGEGFKLRSMKFKGQISQGLCLPVSAFPIIPDDVTVGKDVSKLLNVKKWEIEERATTGGTIIGELPDCVPHTDETRIQAEPVLIKEFSYQMYYITTKMDGSSHSVAIDENGFHVTGHNYEYKDDDSSSFYRYVKSIEIKEKMENFIKDEGLDTFVIQGEFCAPGIQKNRLRLKRPEWYVFTVMENGARAGLPRLLKICSKLGLQTVPIEEVGDFFDEKYPTVESLLERADGEYPNGGKKEGIVIRPVEPTCSLTIKAPLSMKVVNNNYLLRNKE